MANGNCRHHLFLQKEHKRHQNNQTEDRKQNVLCSFIIYDSFDSQMYRDDIRSPGVKLYLLEHGEQEQTRIKAGNLYGDRDKQ